ncbi:MAG: NUDIX hydrolase [Chloroflexota bacterium]
MTLPNRTDHPITAIDSRRAWECRWYSVRQDRINLPNGSEGEYNIVELPDAVWVVPLTTAGEVVLLYHYRYTLGAWGWELPSGSISPGDDALATGQRELAEEAGGTASDWKFLLRASTMKGIGTEYANLYLASGVTLGATHHEPAEVITVHTFSIKEAVRMARAGEIHDAISVLALLLAFQNR